MEYTLNKNELEARLNGIVWVYPDGILERISELDLLADNMQECNEYRDYIYAFVTDYNDSNEKLIRNLEDTESYIDEKLGAIFVLENGTIDTYTVKA